MGYKQVAVSLLLIVALISVSLLSMGGCGGGEGCDIEREVTGSGTCESLADEFQCDSFKFKVGLGCLFGCFVESGTCKLSGCKSGCTNSDVAPPPAPEPSVTAPVLLTPVNNEIIEQNNPDIGCQFNPTSGLGFRLIFDWTDSSSTHGIRGYHFIATNINASFVISSGFVEDSTFSETFCNFFIIDSEVNDWTWTVQAEDNLGNLGSVVTGEFMFEPCRLDDGTPCNTPESPVNVKTPFLLTPANNEIIQQNNPDIGCPFDPTFGFGWRIFFDWTDSGSPNGISGYHLFVKNVNALIPIIDTFVQDSIFTYVDCNSFVIDLNLDGWIWTVQAEDNLGNLSTVNTGDFMFEPCRLDDGTPCNAFE